MDHLDLPPAPAGKSGWPWAPGAEQSTATTSDGASNGPRVTIVTPSYNQAGFLEETVRSVLLQRYPNLEYIIVDGGSCDGSVDIIRKYEDHLAFWVSEPDRGQSDAINKGFQRATGEILAWLNSDDIYYPGTLRAVVDIFRRLPEIDLVFGSAMFVEEDGTPRYAYPGVERSYLRKLQYWRGWDIPQPTLFFRKTVYDEFGGLDENFRYALDYEWLLRVSKTTPSHCASEVLATYRLHGSSKTGTWQASKHLFHRECARAVRKHVRPTSLVYWQWQAAKAAHEVRKLFARAESRDRPPVLPVD
jgi:glycosyltransferase involved in cell wall biosynthesis